MTLRALKALYYSLLRDETYMQELLEASGFRDTKFLTPTRATGLADLGIDETVLALEYESDFLTPHTLIVEARKP